MNLTGETIISMNNLVNQNAMKNLFNLSILAAFTMLFAACANEEMEPVVPQAQTKTITVTLDEVATRTTLNADRTGLAWEIGDKFGYFSNGTGAEANVAVEKVEGKTTYTLNVPTDATEIYAYYPYYTNGNETANSSATSVNLGMGYQTQTEGGLFHGSDYPLVAKVTIEGNNAVLKFEPVLSAVAFNVYNTATDFAAGETVTSVKLIAPNVSGRTTYDLTAGKFTGTPQYSDASVTLTTPVVVASERPNDAKMYADQIYLTVHKGTYTNATLEVVTSANTYTFEGVNLDCTKDIVSMNLNLSKGTTPEPEPEIPEELGFALVKDVSKLAVGDEIVIVAKGVDFAMGADNGNNRDQAAVTRTNSDVNIELTTDVQVLTLEAGATDGTFAFNTGAGYLYAASSKSNHLKTKAELDVNGSWLITVEADGTATVKSQGENTRNWLRYNSSSSIFSCYASGLGDIVIYRNNDSRKALATPAVNTPVVTGNSVTLTWGAVDNATGYNIIYGTDGNTVVESTTGTSISIANLSWNTTYEFVVVAKADVESSSFRDSAFSEAVYAEIGSDPNASVPTESYVLVTNSSALAAGDKVVIVCPTKNMIMGAQSSSYRTGVAVTVNDDAIASLPAGAVELTLENGTESGTFAMKASDGYLYWESSNSVKTGNTPYDWNISIADDVTSITSAATPERKLQWNAGFPRFACYTSKQTAVSIFKLTSN